MSTGDNCKPVVYFIDDQKTARELYRVMFRDSFEICLFPDGQAALETISQVPPDAVVCDLMLPWWDGYSVMEAIHAYDPEMPIIVATAMDGDEQRIVSDSLGYGYYNKATALDLLKELIECSLTPTSKTS